MNFFRKKIIASLLVATFLAIAGGFCCGSSAFASEASHDTPIHYKMLDGNTTTIDSYTAHEKSAKQCHTNTSGRIIDATTVSSTKNTLKFSAPDITVADTFSERAPFAGDAVHIASYLPPPRIDNLFSVIKKE
ncbi:MAG: hypothetical protein PHT88_00555 [Candidatus Moranbacteria bacterium]|nr:hypothetical protein [Candidatus Moranbacteria bacterium]